MLCKNYQIVQLYTILENVEWKETDTVVKNQVSWNITPHINLGIRNKNEMEMKQNKRMKFRTFN